MKQNFTSNELIGYLYNETSAFESLAIHDALCEDVYLQEEFGALVYASQQLPKVQFRPTAGTIQKILKYSECARVGKEA